MTPIEWGLAAAIAGLYICLLLVVHSGNKREDRMLMRMNQMDSRQSKLEIDKAVIAAAIADIPNTIARALAPVREEIRAHARSMGEVQGMLKDVVDKLNANGP